MNKTVAIVAVLSGTLAVAAAAFAMTTGRGSGFTSLGPYSGPGIGVPGSCGNVWVVDNFQTSYRVYPQRADGSFVVEQDARAHGLTQAGSSPEACAPGSAATVAAGIPVSSDYLSMEVITGGSFNPSANCSAPCFFAQFVPSFFGASATVTQVSAIDTFNTACNGSVIDNGFAGTVAGDISGAVKTCPTGD